MQCDASPNAGFTRGVAWLPAAPNYRDVNIEAEADDPRSILTLHRRLIGLRRSCPAPRGGDWQLFAAERGVLAYLRRNRGSGPLVVLNLGPHLHRLGSPGPGRVLLSTYLDRDDDRVSGVLELRAAEGVVMELERDD